jgi:selenoprotein W-related protein
LADVVEKEIGVRPKLIEGGGGVFEVTVDGDLVFSKKKLGRFPEDDEVIAILKKKKS